MHAFVDDGPICYHRKVGTVYHWCKMKGKFINPTKWYVFLLPEKKAEKLRPPSINSKVIPSACGAKYSRITLEERQVHYPHKMICVPFTINRRLANLRPPSINGRIIPPVCGAKYSRITRDRKLNWNWHPNKMTLKLFFADMSQDMRQIMGNVPLALALFESHHCRARTNNRTWAMYSDRLAWRSRALCSPLQQLWKLS